MTEAYPAQVIGSMLRPGYLKQAHAAFAAGELPAVELKRIEDRAVDQAVARQEGAGIDVITDGEMRRASFATPLMDYVEGIERAEGSTMPWKRDDGQPGEATPFVVTGKIRKRRSVVIEEYSYARARARKPLKVTLPSPLLLFANWSPQHSAAAYGDPFEMFADATAVIRSEAEELAALGCTHIQIDAPELAMLVEPQVRDWYAEHGMAPERLLTEGIDLISAVVEGLDGVHTGIHLCRGNNAGMWMAEGGYDYIAEALFGRARGFDSFLLEYDDHRSGSFEPLSNAPQDKRLVLGLVSSKVPSLESREELVARIDEAARFFPREQMALSTQCGFASIAAGNPLTEEDEDRKLELVADVAHEVWA